MTDPLQKVREALNEAADHLYEAQDMKRVRDYARAALKSLDAIEHATTGLLDPDMPAQQLRLHMGEMTAQEERTARAAIRWANFARNPSTDRVVDIQQGMKALEKSFTETAEISYPQEADDPARYIDGEVDLKALTLACAKAWRLKWK